MIWQRVIFLTCSAFLTCLCLSFAVADEILAVGDGTLEKVEPVLVESGGIEGRDEAGDDAIAPSSVSNALADRMLQMAEAMVEAATSHASDCDAMARTLESVWVAHASLMREFEEATEQASEEVMMKMRRHAQALGMAMAVCHDSEAVAAVFAQFSVK